MKKIFFLIIVADKFYTNNTLFIYRECYYSNKKFIILNPMDDYMKMIVFELRLPRIIMAFLVGMLLASSGNIVQIIFQNPLARSLYNWYCFKCNFWSCYSLSVKITRILLWSNSFLSLVC